jgi:SAM-dependent methyltransferase
MIPDQKVVWDKKHSAGDHEKLRHVPSPLANLAEPYFPRQSYILELGCGVGRDAEFFAQKSHKVLATDGSEVVIKQNQGYLASAGIEFEILDMQDPLPYQDGSFDVVYANLSLHYYSHDKTREIMKQIARVLKITGLIAFACKSTDDFHHGNGEEVEENIFVSPKGHVRHLFSVGYTKQLLEVLFDIQYLDKIEEEYNGQHSNIVRCVAKKVNYEK